MVKDLQDSLSRKEDELDEVKQRSLKGSIILSSDRRNGTVIKSDEELKKSGKSICDHTLNLIIEKYNVVKSHIFLHVCKRQMKDLIFIDFFEVPHLPTPKSYILPPTPS